MTDLVGATVRMRSGMARMSRAQYLEYLRKFRGEQWLRMMCGDADAWLWFFRAIEDGQGRNIIAENSRLPRLPMSLPVAIAGGGA